MGGGGGYTQSKDSVTGTCGCGGGVHTEQRFCDRNLWVWGGGCTHRAKILGQELVGVGGGGEYTQSKDSVTGNCGCVCGGGGGGGVHTEQRFCDRNLWVCVWGGCTHRAKILGQELVGVCVGGGGGCTHRAKILGQELVGVGGCTHRAKILGQELVGVCRGCTHRAKIL